MISGSRRLVACLAVALTMTLAGCDVSGRVEWRSPDEAVVDVTIVHAMDELQCAGGVFGGASGLEVVESLDANGTPSCHLRGTVDPERLRPWLSATHVGEFMTLSFNPLGVAPGRPADSGSWAGLGAIDVTVQFPGQVLSTTGDADGNAVHFRDADQLTRPYGLRADALDHPGPAWVVIGPVAGFVGGVLAAGLGVMLWRRRRRTGEEPESGQDDLIATDADDLIGPAAVDGSPVEPSDAWSAAGAARPAQPRTPAAPPPAVPSVIPGATPDPVPPRRRPDDSVWAPPGDP